MYGSFPEPRAFQYAAHEALRQGFRDGHRRQVIMAPTGAGKTFIGMRLINEAVKKGKRAIFACDRVSLINQTSEVAHKYGMHCHSIIQADNPRLDLMKLFQIASVQTLARRGWPPADLIVVDECHTMHKQGWTDFIMSPECTASVIGLSATPFSKGLGRIFTNLVNAATMHDLTQSGVLVPMRVFSGRRPDMAGVELNSKGEWKESAVESKELVLVGDVVKEWLAHGEGRKTIVFGSTIRHCAELTRQFNEAGVPAAMYTADTPDDERESILADYRLSASYIKVLISVEALAKGFDVPDVGCVCDCRPLRKSLSTAIQMWGRGLRSDPDSGKVDCILLDFSGNIVRFLDDYTDIFFNGLDALDAGEKLDRTAREEKEGHEPSCCPKCGYLPMGKRCMKCGFEPTPRSLVETVPGKLEEIRIGNKLLASNVTDLWAQVCTYAKNHGNPEKQEKKALAIYRNITGEWPPRGLRFDSAPDVEPTINTLNKIRSLNIAWARRRAA